MRQRTKPTAVGLYDVFCGGQSFAQGCQELLGKAVTVQIVKLSELHTLAVIPKRWLNTRLQLVDLAFLARLLRRPQTRSEAMQMEYRRRAFLRLGRSAALSMLSIPAHFAAPWQTFPAEMRLTAET